MCQNLIVVLTFSASRNDLKTLVPSSCVIRLDPLLFSVKPRPFVICFLHVKFVCVRDTNFQKHSLFFTYFSVVETARVTYTYKFAPSPFFYYQILWKNLIKSYDGNKENLFRNCFKNNFEKLEPKKYAM